VKDASFNLSMDFFNQFIRRAFVRLLIGSLAILIANANGGA
jgi:hypothetical protein